MRIKLVFPEKVVFTTQVPIRITDINYGNHVGNDRMLTLAHEARVQWFASLGYSELEVDGNGLIMADAAIQFLAEAFYGDDLIIEMGIDDIRSSSFDVHYRFLVSRNNVKIEVARVKTAMVFFNYSVRKVSPMSEKFRRTLEDLLSENT